jgi:hypothetical protein
MIFEGESPKWKASLVVKEISDKKGTKKPGFTLTMTPKSDYNHESLTYTIFTDNGNIKKIVVQTGKTPIALTTTAFIPQVDEEIVLCIQSASTHTKNYVMLKQILPETIKVSPKEAVNILVEEYHNAFHKQIPYCATFKLEIEYEKYWMITIHNFDGEDRMACLLINAQTGKSEGMKMEE